MNTYEIERKLSEKADGDSHDTQKCQKCGGVTALVTGILFYEPHGEPYENGVLQKAKVGAGECWIGAYKCKCGNIQGFWTE